MTEITTEQAFKIFYPKTMNSRPHVEVKYDDSALSNESSNSKKNILLIGSSTAGNPNVVYELNSFSEAQSVFQSGDLVRACELIWNPVGNNTMNGGTIYAMRVNTATPAKLVEGNLTFNSKVYGAVANGTFVTWDTDSITGARRLRVRYDGNGYNKLYTNIGNVFSIAYNGTQAAAGYSVDADEDGKAIKFHLYAGATISQEVAAFDLTSSLYSTVYQVLDAINKVPGFTVTITGSSTSIPSYFLDKTTKPVDITSTKSSNTPMQVTAITGDLLYQTLNDPYISITADLKTDLPKPFPETALTGGTDGTVPADWSDKFLQARGHDVYYIVPLTDQDVIHAELKAFLEEQDQLGYQYRGFVGGGMDEDVNSLIGRQIALKEPRIALIGNSGTYAGLAGGTYHIPGYLMAAYVAGICSSLPIGEACTNKPLDSLISLDTVFSGEELNRLDQNGVIAIDFVDDRQGNSSYRVVEDVTTYNSSNEPVEGLVSLGETKDFLLDGLRRDLSDNYIGISLRVTSPDLIRVGVESYLDKQVKAGLLVKYDPNDITVLIDNDQAYISFSCTPTRTLRNILVATTFDSILLQSNQNSVQDDFHLAVN